MKILPACLELLLQPRPLCRRLLSSPIAYSLANTIADKTRTCTILMKQCCWLIVPCFVVCCIFCYFSQSLHCFLKRTPPLTHHSMTKTTLSKRYLGVVRRFPTPFPSPPNSSPKPLLSHPPLDPSSHIPTFGHALFYIHYTRASTT